jgi:hypothetical protein
MEPYSAGEGKVPTPVGSVGGGSDSGIFGGLNCMQVYCHRVLTDSERFREREGGEKGTGQRETARMRSFVTQTRTRTIQPLCQESSCCKDGKDSSRGTTVSPFRDQYVQVHVSCAGMPCDWWARRRLCSSNAYKHHRVGQQTLQPRMTGHSGATGAEGFRRGLTSVASKPKITICNAILLRAVILSFCGIRVGKCANET